ncbi:MAG TPA: type VI secretion system baseplate subunit TssG [Dinghuibacter sp.]|uniref:type VI secretion system baseplate subunit TssG n=1 Tax=Dinghuibacter sp. TaxID=2024697 RepID=UPI002B772F0E|nr:type VI secretion system baseplate subunit TssG [Dinghuibacter sp.]HTJ10842.1 type VI secretion system baseplate subunit TssG [Dinghuibacter sp.]
MNERINIKDVVLPEADIRLEVILAELGALGLSADDILVLRKSLFRRNFSREIEKVEEMEVGQSRRKRLAVHINREGLYDRLPQDLIHQPEPGVKSGVQDIARQAEREKGARMFFLPYEQELSRLLLRLEWEERQFIFETNSDVSGELMGLLWDMPEHLTSFQRSKLGVILPLLHRFGGDNERLAFVLENIAGYPVTVRTAPPARTWLDDVPLLGDAYLGVDSLLPGEVVDTQLALRVTVRANRAEDLDDLLPGGSGLQTLEYLAGALTPIEQDVVFEPDLEGCLPAFTLGDERAFAGRLDYTTIL